MVGDSLLFDESAILEIILFLDNIHPLSLYNNTLLSPQSHRAMALTTCQLPYHDAFLPSQSDRPTTVILLLHPVTGIHPLGLGHTSKMRLDPLPGLGLDVPLCR